MVHKAKLQMTRNIKTNWSGLTVECTDGHMCDSLLNLADA